VASSNLTAEIIDGPVPMIQVRGELDLSTAPGLCQTVETVADRGRLLIDLSELSFCDSTGLRALVGAVREVEINGGKAALAVPPGGPLDRILELTGLGEFLRVTPSVEDARQRLS
jgi:anti-sigma B factor antagonist